MVIKVEQDGTIIWKFYRKQYRKARWRKCGKRELNWLLKLREEDSRYHGLIIVR